MARHPKMRSVTLNAKQIEEERGRRACEKCGNLTTEHGRPRCKLGGALSPCDEFDDRSRPRVFAVVGGTSGVPMDH